MDEIKRVLKNMGFQEQLGQPKSGKVSARHYVESYRCVKCQDAGFLHPRYEDGTVDFSRTVTCECREEENKRLHSLQLIRMCELPSGTDAYTFDNFKVRRGLERAYKSAKELADYEGELKWLTLIGDVDVGKTHLAIAVCRRWLLRGIPARYAYVPLLLDELRQGYRMEGDYAFDYRFKVLCTVPLLILDDLGAENGTNWAREKLDTIVDTRAMHGLAMVVTTNLGMNELPRRIASRLQRATFSEVIHIDAKEYRLFCRKR